MDDIIRETDLWDTSSDMPEPSSDDPFPVMEKIMSDPDAGESTCIICGESLTAFGSINIKDGTLCRNCKKMISEWFSDETVSGMTSDEIRTHLEYRRRNREKLAAFVPVYVAGGKYKLYVDEPHGRFLISKKKDFAAANADILSLSAIKQIRSYTSVDAVQNYGDVMIDIDMEEGEIRHLSFRVNEFPGLETDSDEFIKAKNDSLDMAELFKDSGIDEERIVFEYGK